MPNQTQETIDVQNEEVPSSHVNYSYDASTLEAAREWSWACGQSGLQNQALSSENKQGSGWYLKGNYAVMRWDVRLLKTPGTLSWREIY